LNVLSTKNSVMLGQDVQFKFSQNRMFTIKTLGDYKAQCRVLGM